MASGILSSILRMVDKLSVPIRRSLGGSTSTSSSDPRNIEEDLNKLKSALSTIDTVLFDAEKKEIREESVKLWLRELKGVAYDAEDVLDEFEYELLKSKLERKPTPHKRKQEEVREFTTSPLNEPSFRYRMASRIKEIRERFDEIAKERATLQLREGDGQRRRVEDYLFRPPTSSHVDKSEVLGREEDSKKVIELLLLENCDGTNVSIIPIVGMGGIGKTTLVQIIYNDSKVIDRFDTRTWVCVSENFHVDRLMRAIIESIKKAPCDLTELSSLQESLKEVLGGKRFLLVLDDVWNEEQIQWEMLKSSLISDVEGSKIVVTSRNEAVARIMHAEVPPYRLNCLSDAACWLLFRRQAFNGRDLDANPDLVKIGKMITVKCRGLPLAAKVLGGLLQYETDEENWTELLESDLWDLDEAEDEILPALKLSYQHLPVHLKRCFVYCSVFPKGFMFKKDQLVRMWMVQGFLHSKDSKEEPEDTGSRCFDELVWRSFFEERQIDIGEEETFVMHDLIHDLARSISGEECCSTEDADLSKILKEAARHVLLIPPDSKTAMRFYSTDKPIALRSLLLIYRLIYSWGGVAMPQYENLVHVKIPNDIFMNLRYLRSLDLGYTDIQELPDSIGGLKHLRYLGLRNTKIQKLPESICRLYHLQTLELKYCSNLRELPSGIGNLINLRHLELPTMDDSFVCMPSGIGKLTGLQELAAFNVGSDGRHCKIGELRDMASLRGDLHVSGLRNVARGWDAKEANLKNMKNLQRLTLDWYVHPTDYKCSHQKNTMNSENDWAATTMPWEHFQEEGMVLDSLRPHPNLIVLDIRNYNGIKFPTWVGDPSFSDLVTIRLFICEKCEALPPLGQLPSLKNLYIMGMGSIRQVGLEFCSGSKKSFPALEKLEFEWMPEWEEWCKIEEGAFPHLAELAIKNCPKLRIIPNWLAPSLKKLEIGDCKRLTVLPNAPSLTTLCIGGECQQQLWSYTADLTALETLEIVYCEDLTCLILHNLPALKRLEISNCSQLASINCRGSVGVAAASSSSRTPSAEGLHNLVSLEELKIEDCPLLRFSEDERLPQMLRAVEIACCPMLMEWCGGEEGSRQLKLIPQISVEDYDPDEFQKWVMDTENEESEEEDMEED